MFYGFLNLRRYRLIGPSALFLDPLPGIIGGQISGKFDVACESVDTPINIVLTCKKTIVLASAVVAKGSINILLKDSMVALPETTISGMQMRFLFDCPADLPDSNDSSISWQVRAEGVVNIKGKAVKFLRDWDIPVEKK